MDEIKDAADAMFSDGTYQSITLTGIADRLGCSRTQIYKYVATKEEVFLELAGDKRRAYFDALLAAFPPGCSYSLDVFAEVWAEILNAHRDFLKYSDILMTIIETNVTVERLARFKSQYYTDLEPVVGMMANNLGIDRECAENLYYTIYFQAIGLSTYCGCNPLVEQALKIAEIEVVKPDFRTHMKDFILMCLEKHVLDSGKRNDI